MILIIIPSFIFAVAATSIRAWTLGLKLILIDQDYSDQKKIEESSRCLRVFGNMCAALGIFFTLFGAMQILNDTDLTNATAEYIYKVSSICMLTLLYGIAIKCILYVADQRLCNKYLI